MDAVASLNLLDVFLSCAFWKVGLLCGWRYLGLIRLVKQSS